ncbi:MAG: hypothetical protein ACOC9Y_08580, partial [Chloroflexota bacterium]
MKTADVQPSASVDWKSLISRGALIGLGVIALLVVVVLSLRIGSISVTNDHVVGDIPGSCRGLTVRKH